MDTVFYLEKWCLRTVRESELYASKTAIIAETLVVDGLQFSARGGFTDVFTVCPVARTVANVYHLIQIRGPSDHEGLKNKFVSKKIVIAIMTQLSQQIVDFLFVTCERKDFS